MNLFNNMSGKLNHIFSKLTKKGRLTELEINNAMREIRVALLEADVNFSVVKEFISRVKEKSLGETVLKSLTPGQQIIKIVNEELIKLMGDKSHSINIAKTPPTKIILFGLQGAGKTTMSAKIALKFKKDNKKVMLVALDIYRPAAIDQLKTLAKSVDIEVFEKGTQSPTKTAKQAIKYANEKDFDMVIFDTAGRLHINNELMSELKQVQKVVNPDESLLVVDSMTGQDAVTTAQEFDKEIGITGTILTKLDGDTRGGAALSIKQVTGKPIKFSGIGEKLGDIEVFHPERMASRILGKGDVLTLIEKAQENIDKDEMIKTQEAIMKNKFSLHDYLNQIESMSKMGNFKDLMSMIPGMGKYKSMIDNFDDKKIIKQKAIIQSMTLEERYEPKIIKGSRKKRIAKGSATSLNDINILLKQFEQMKLMMKKMKGNKGNIPGMPNMPF